MEGLALRYGRLYGPGAGTDAPPPAPAAHLDAAARAALLAIDDGRRGCSTSPIPASRVERQGECRAWGWRADFRLDAV
jgi:hypothetical protein